MKPLVAFWAFILLTTIENPLVHITPNNITAQRVRELPAEKTWSWLGSIGAPCEGFGIHGSYRVHVTAQVEYSGTGRKITALTLWLSGAMIKADSTNVEAKLEVKKGTQTVKTVLLSRPDPGKSVIEQQPGANESNRLYLPKDNPSIEAPASAKLIFTVTAQVKTDSGSCALGTSNKEIDIFAQQ